MILAINANAAVDQVLFIDQFIPGSVMRPSRSVLSVGGKGLDTAVILKTLGAPVQAVSFIAGENGKILARLLSEKDIPTDLIWLDGETRFSHVIVETDHKRHSHINTSGYTINEADCQVFLQRVALHAPECSWAALAGSLPGGADDAFYGRVIEVLQRCGVKTLVDTTGAAALGSLSAAPDILKMNQAEFTHTFHLHPANQTEWLRACRQVMMRHSIGAFVLTCGKEGLLACAAEESYHATAPLLEEVNAAGSGDAVSAALIYRLSLGDSWEQALRWAAATGAAVVLTEGTAECHLDDIHRLYSQTQVIRIKDPR